MRKLVSGLFITLDGVTESPDKWQEHFDEDMGNSLNAHMAEVDTILLGRVTYDEWAPYWPTAGDDQFGVHINNAPKYVVSQTLDKVAWGKFDNVTLIKGNLAESIAKLKQQPGKSISVAGSPSLVRSLIQDDLLDELTLLIHPVVAGKGKRLFNDGNDLKRLKLLNSQATRTGTIIATYEPVKKA
jgi:dihydrofolate reductase